MSAAAPDGPALGLGDRILVSLFAEGAISADNAERARRAHARAGGSLVDIIIRLGLCEEKALARAVAAVAGLDPLKDEDVPAEALFADRLSVPFLRDARVLPLAERDDAVLCAAADPTNEVTKRALVMAFAKSVAFVVGAASQIDQALLRLYSDAGAGAAAATTSAASDVTETDVARLRESASEAPIVRFVEQLIARAVDAGASDIHIEPLQRRLRIRLRVDGILHEEEPAPLSSAPAIVSRVKILSRLDIAERRLPQDGSIKLNVRGREIDLRVATAPVANGEAIAIRVLDRETVRLDLTELGFGEALLGGFRKALLRPNGIILVTGPTGAGKSTTLYAALNTLNTVGRKIVTVEDPVEYKIDGLNQIQVKPDIGLDFARTLRSILRHDPDVIMVGEIRDAETARIAIQAALTGHLVLSTLHTNDAASAVTRLLDMGIEDYLLTSTIACVVAQRLVRRLCRECRRAVPAPQFLDGAREVFAAEGCPSCRGTGYRGRMIIAELLEMSGDVRRAVLDQAEAAELRDAALRSGMRSLYDNGLDAVRFGATSLEEVMRVAQDLGD
jgi:general secretion pathway protein E